MPSVELISVGTELLLGQLVDTNATFVAQRLAENGIDVRATHAIGDNRERIAAAITTCLERCDGVVTTGGLGPTVDDLTKEAVCDAFGLDTELNEPALTTGSPFTSTWSMPEVLSLRTSGGRATTKKSADTLPNPARRASRKSSSAWPARTFPASYARSHAPPVCKNHKSESPLLPLKTVRQTIRFCTSSALMPRSAGLSLVTYKI